jgi:hypothetical protein
MSKTYGEMIDDLVDGMAKYDDRAAIFRRNDVPKGHFYNVINPNRQTTTGNPFYTPVEWMVKLTRDSQDFDMVKRVVKDCGAIVITPEELNEMKSADLDKAVDVFKRFIGAVK